MGLFDKLFKKKETQHGISDGQVEIEKPIEQMTFQKSQTEIKEQIKRGYIGTYRKQVDYDTVKELKERYIAFDVETTVLSPNRCRKTARWRAAACQEISMEFLRTAPAGAGQAVTCSTSGMGLRLK